MQRTMHLVEVSVSIGHATSSAEPILQSQKMVFTPMLLETWSWSISFLRVTTLASTPSRG